eukprot:11051668-Alexandrium_andersonii.AAC.1
MPQGVAPRGERGGGAQETAPERSKQRQKFTAVSCAHQVQRVCSPARCSAMLSTSLHDSALACAALRYPKQAAALARIGRCTRASR